MFDASHDAGCQETSLGRHKRPSRKGTTPQHTLDPLLLLLLLLLLLFFSRDKLEVWQQILKLWLPTAFYHTELMEIRDQSIDTEWNNGEQQQDKVLCSLIRSSACFL